MNLRLGPGVKIIKYCMSKKSWPILYWKLLYKMCQDFLDIKRADIEVGRSLPDLYNLDLLREILLQSVLYVQEVLSNFHSMHNLNKTSWTYCIQTYVFGVDMAFKISVICRGVVTLVTCILV